MLKCFVQIFFLACLCIPESHQESLDVDGDFVISKNEFVERCMQLHGAARSVDLLLRAFQLVHPNTLLRLFTRFTSVTYLSVN